VATVATNPAVVGAVSIRAVALKIAGEAVPDQILVKPALITQATLREAGVTTIEELAAKVPAFSASDAAVAGWIPAALY
jgi:simple sugar transport system substrate-binding protein